MKTNAKSYETVTLFESNKIHPLSITHIGLILFDSSIYMLQREFCDKTLP